ncbi:MAG TPA: saccharopine dehydrogenase NADP-binding domain-containing protein [Steroidobacteraceae bacterium]|jgi:hypothetical protein
MARPIVLILGGYGVFGRRIAANLARREEIDLVIAGRHAAAAAALVQALGTGRARSLAVDMEQPNAVSALLAAKPAVVVDTLGPFQTRNLALPRSCAGRGVHYVDISDARARTADIVSLDAAARVEHAAVICGASAVPAISTAIVDELAPKPHEVVSIDVGISPGHRAPPGIATVASILGYCGKPIPPVCGDRETYGWGDLTRFQYPAPAGERWLSNLDSPERVLWRTRYPSLEEADVRLGFEVGILHLALSALSRGVRIGVLPPLTRLAKPILQMAKAFNPLGSDTAVMHVRVGTRDAHARTATRTGIIVAEHGDGLEVPAAPASAVVKKLLGLRGYAPIEKRGAFACIGILTREEIMHEMRDFSVRYEADR